MADTSQLESAFMKADAAGDTGAASVLAAEIKRLRVAPAPQAAAPEQQAPLVTRLGGLSKTPFSAPDMGNMGYNLGGKVTDIASGAGLSPELSGGLGYGSNVAFQALAPMAIGSAAGQLMSPALQGAGKSLMRSALNAPLKDRMSGDAERAMQTMLDKGYNATVGGGDAMGQAASGLGNQVTSITNQSPNVIQKAGVYGPVHEALTRALKQVNPNADANAVRNAWTEFDAAFPGDTIPVKLAQALKQGTYRALGDKAYGVPMASDMASQGAQKSITRGINEQIGRVEPATAPLLSEQSDLLNAAKLATRRGMTQQGTTMLGIAPAASSPARFAAFLLDKYGLSKSLLARALYSGSERIPQAAGGITAAMAQALMQQQQQGQQP